MNKKLLLRKFHRYIALVVGLQLLFWSLGGLYFSLMPLDEIHGDHLKQTELSQWHNVKAVVPMSNVLTAMEVLGLTESQISNVNLLSLRNRLVYKVEIRDSAEIWFDALSGVRLEKISELEIKRVAKQYSKNAGDVIAVNFLSSVSEDHEYRGHVLPAYQVIFGGKHNLHMYLDVYSGQLISMRTDEWRIFDFLWMLHVMDYQTRDDFNHGLLQSFAALAVLTSLSGIVLWFISRRKRLVKVKSGI